MKNNVILGAGIAGLSANYELEKAGVSSKCYEMDQQYGGLCASFSIGEFVFDKFVHLSFTNDEEVKSVFTAGSDFYTHYPEAMNYADGAWIRHPVQNNLYTLPTQEKIEIIKSFVKKPSKNDVNNYEEWLKAQYGEYFAEKYPMRYTRKYWGVDAHEMGTEWTGGRLFIPDLDEILYSAFEQKTKNVYYAKEMRYPVRGGYQAFLSAFVNNSRIAYGKKAIRIDEKERKVYFEDGECVEYDNLISTLPLPELVESLSYANESVREAAENLLYTSGYIVSIGLNKVKEFPSLWFYIYDEDILPARIHSPSMKSKNNVPEGKSSLQAEIYFSNKKPMHQSKAEILEDTIAKLVSMGLFLEEDVEVKDIRLIKYANVICDQKIDANRNIIKDYLDSNGIIMAGRFGEWKYFWSDQSFLSGKHAADLLIEVGNV